MLKSSRLWSLRTAIRHDLRSTCWRLLWPVGCRPGSTPKLDRNGCRRGREYLRAFSVKQRMRRHAAVLWIATAVLTTGASLLWAIPAFTSAPLSPVVPRRVQFVLPSSHPTVQGRGPGIYRAVPHSLWVLVPDEVDPRMVYRPDTSRFRTPVHHPPGYFERR